MSMTIDQLKDLLTEALRAAKMESMSLGFPNDRIEVKSVLFGDDDKGRVGEVMHPTDYVKKITANYRASWIVGPIERALELVEQNRKLIQECEKLREHMRSSGIDALIELAHAGMDGSWKR